MTRRLYVLTFLVVLGSALAQAQTFTTLYNFTNGSDGGGPWTGVIQDPAGNLYGTTELGGDSQCYNKSSCGVVYELNTAGIETVLYSFTGNPDGWGPSTPVIRDKTGNIYGTTDVGGFGESYGNGTVFKIDAGGNETMLYRFTGGSDGCSPYQGLVRDKAGNLYGTTSECGSSFWGTIFKVDIAGNFTLLHTFAGPPSDGGAPTFGHLTMDNFGNLYGTAGGGTGCGGAGCGVLYELRKGRTLTQLHRFKGGSDGCVPQGSVMRDKAGNFYGTTYQCGSNNYGTIWKVSSKGKETILHSFAGGTSDGCKPFGGVTLDAKGNLYGVTSGCGTNGNGALFELSARGKLTLLHSFNGSDGSSPWGEVLRTSEGTLFGTTYEGGTYNYGTVWSYVP